MWRCTIYDGGARTAADRICAVVRYYDIYSKVDRGDIFIVQRSKIIISHTPIVKLTLLYPYIGNIRIIFVSFVCLCVHVQLASSEVFTCQAGSNLELA